jgi:hypothetical protein
MMDRRGQLGAEGILLAGVIPEPGLAGLEALDDWMAGVRRVMAGVLGRGRVATADMPAAGAPTEVEPPAAGRQAFDAARPAGLGRRVKELRRIAHRSPRLSGPPIGTRPDVHDYHGDADRGTQPPPGRSLEETWR